MNAERHIPEVSQQTGFPSPATHYAEPTIDLATELVGNKDATFFVRVAGDHLSHLNIYNQDVLIIDRSLKMQTRKLALVVIEGEFKIKRIEKAEKEEFILWGVITYIIHSVK